MWKFFDKLFGKSPTRLQQTDHSALADSAGTCPDNYRKPGNAEECDRAYQALGMYTQMDGPHDLQDVVRDKYTLNRDDCERTAAASGAKYYAWKEAGVDNCKVSHVTVAQDRILIANPLVAGGEFKMYKYGAGVRVSTAAAELKGCYMDETTKIGVYNENGKTQKYLDMVARITTGGLETQKNNQQFICTKREAAPPSNNSLGPYIAIVAAILCGAVAYAMYRNWDTFVQKFKGSSAEEYLLS